MTIVLVAMAVGFTAGLLIGSLIGTHMAFRAAVRIVGAIPDPISRHHALQAFEAVTAE